MRNLTKPSSIVTLLSALCSLAAAIVMQVSGGNIGDIKVYNYYNPVMVGLLFACVAIAAVLILIKLPGLASLTVTALPGIALCVFYAIGGNGGRPAYWHFADLAMKVDAKVIDPVLLSFTILLVFAFILGEVAIYLRKTPAIKE